ncbi:phage GP46 family protein [Bosea sp. FBZP-16]|uniref:phage GP46 family protein n=1 Tax=Bosea sp. FBZP-16 TaxID=2065382 RepID=UPI000C30DF89|nr:phage GP46 family protein [Bosea sp. FBZP-16]
MAADFIDVALIFDPETRTVDAELGEDGDLLLDETALTPMLISLGTDRRARPDDALPQGRDALNVSSSFVTRRGWSGDALDAYGRRAGSRLWLMERAKQHELTDLFVMDAATEALRWAKAETGTPAQISVSWPRRNLLALTCRIGDTEFDYGLRVG